MLQGQEMRQGQGLFMNGQMRQALHLLHLTNADLQAYLEEQAASNPLLELPQSDLPPVQPMRSERGQRDLLTHGVASEDDGTARLPDMPLSLTDRLYEQLRLSLVEKTDLQIGAYLIEALDAAGRLVDSAERFSLYTGYPAEDIERVRQYMMRFEPVGIFARSLRECLAVQLHERGALDAPMEKLLDHMNLLARGEMARLARLCGVNLARLEAMVAELKRLDPKPGFDPGSETLPVRTADMIVSADGHGSWTVELNTQTLPRVMLAQDIQTRVSLHGKDVRPQDRQVTWFMNQWRTQANWLVRGLELRCNTLLRVAREIFRRQEKFLTVGPSGLAPMTLRDVADSIGVHESTVSRAVFGKSISTPQGLFTLRFFFSSVLASANQQAHSAEAVREVIRRLVAGEQERAVLSDDDLVRLLLERGIVIARRTVAKYRELMNIPPSFSRKRQIALRKGQHAA
ncbi:RNA polymerase factor sigma-54 [Acetobacter peroxydans]|uniref:RNA polymerase sigma-54 factor n=1 Tax=Acetobacter peroxydans TaxID=104098 RepID=A0A4Y3TWA7_9PROT|nr:RNA polymerase factor sigma-54 [Acetobacter peroxydans]NHO16131.1 RNA polymerase factor sigma-54 [Acetobacter peroxydans]GBR34882.1 RNA polymerase sigma-54 factor RpoN [Acetobacter peroxydans NBRC 13755]GBR40502.1 RNA polymerase sigma-54 factor RpoN [Acetobacter peroxydans]GEB86132.1 RNA polymerase sigma-54 factor 1 [Acetobacter peroxydans]